MKSEYLDRLSCCYRWAETIEPLPPTFPLSEEEARSLIKMILEDEISLATQLDLERVILERGSTEDWEVQEAI